MIIISIALSSLALLAATAALVLDIRDRKRNQKRNAALQELDTRVNRLEEGVVPNFEKAREAAKAVNDFNDGISGILGFDPYEVLKRQRGGERE